MGIDCSPLMLWKVEFLNCAYPRGKSSSGVFSNDAKFNACTVKFYGILGKTNTVTQGNSYLLPDQVGLLAVNVTYTGGNIIFHLYSGIYFKQIRLAVLGNNPFPGANIVIAYMGGQL